jgi:ATP-dependent RNA helicase SUPV3L1/SUV3
MPASVRMQLGAARRRLSPEEIRRGAKSLMSRTETTYAVFEKLLLEQADVLRKNILRSRQYEQSKAWGVASKEDLEGRLDQFEDQIIASCKSAERGRISKEDNPLFFRLRYTFVTGNMMTLQSELKYAFINSVVNARFSNDEKTNQEKLADLRNPLDWFPATRAIQRTVHLHVGPTNSGKTYHALKRLEEAETGVYAGPLRLLAHEVYSRFNAKGKQCALITGEERRIPEGMRHVMNSCTVEMVPLNVKVDVAVIDEIQMMGDRERGWAWSQAFLGVQAKEVHVCGELRTINLVTDLCAAMGDKLVIHRYERLSPLKTMDRSLKGDLKNLQKGDAVILFSRLAIHAMKADIEKATGKRCAVVYGSLPPETRAQQAALFNDPNNDYDYLVASDAVGMGLNLSIKRVIFEATSKFDGSTHRLLPTSEIKQIAGRAGRYKTAQDAIKKEEVPMGITDGKEPLQLDLVKKSSSNVGYVTCLENFDLPILREAMRTEVEPLKTAGIFPPSNILLRFAQYFPPKTPFSYIALRLHEIANLSLHFHLCILKEQIEVADCIQGCDLSATDRIQFMSAPVAMREPGFTDTLVEYAECVAKNSGGELLDLKTLNLELLDMDIHDHPHSTKGYLRDAEGLHKAITLYLWLSYRFAGVFRSQALAFHVKSLVEQKIDECLAEASWDTAQRRQRAKIREKAFKAQARQLTGETEYQPNVDADFAERMKSTREDDTDSNEIVEALERQPGQDEKKEIEDADSNNTLDWEGKQSVREDPADSEDSPASEANVPIPPASEDEKPDRINP